MYNFENVNEAQKKAITSVDGPVLIIAGPETGKTYTLVQRAIFLIEKCGIKPESIFMATFTEKAAKELITRITNAFSNCGINVNINNMYVGTFHSLCLRILREHLEHTRLSKNYRILNDFDQYYLVYQNIKSFLNIHGINNVLSLTGNDWKHAKEICRYVDILSEELVASEELKADQNEDVVAVGEILETYQAILKENNMIDFSSMQSETYKLLCDHSEVLEELQSRVTHIMIDEYQDTNYIQEQLVLLLGGKSKNICVVGDDDQALYRFRNATVRNILEFPQNFAAGECKKISLVTNYRSNSDIVDFYNRWMVTTRGEGFCFNWDNFRHDKRIEPHERTKLNSPAVVKLFSQNNEYEWHQKIFTFIKGLKDSGKITDYNQIAFLFKSVKHNRVTALAQFLEENGINVYSPRSKMFFQREEVQLMLGCLLIMFPNYTNKLGNMNNINQPEYLKYYKNCILLARDQLIRPENRELLKWIWNKRQFHSSLTGITDYTYCGLIYQLFKHKLFSKILDIDVNGDVINTRPLRNIAKLTKLIGKFEAMYGLDFIDAKEYAGNSELYEGCRMIDLYTEHMFNQHLRMFYDEGISEYEDESEYAPSGCVSFMTIHQSKGMEFTIVVVASLWEWPWPDDNTLMNNIEERYFKRKTSEPFASRSYFDFWRLYYTAFSRAQNLLVLSCNEDNNIPSRYFEPLYGNLPSLENRNFDIREFTFELIHNVNLKNTYSFTSQIAPYEICSLQYKFYNELGFHKAHTRNTLLGTLVHETIEDIHRAVLRHEEQIITEDNINRWFYSNYASLIQSRYMNLKQSQLNDALKQVLRYVNGPYGDWSRIRQAEVKLSLAKPDYIIEGKIDLIRSDGDKVEIVDFKTERKPRLIPERYSRQLKVYAYLVEQCTAQEVSKMILYYTGEKSENATVTFCYDEDTVNDIMTAFDETVHSIMNRDFSKCANNPDVCKKCDFQSYCNY